MPTPFPKPPFSALPLVKPGPPGNAWGLFGPKDELGMLNLLTPENTAEAAKEIQDGVRVSTDWPLNSMAKPCFHRTPFRHELHPLKAFTVVNDDTLTFNPQSSSQWDGFRHFGYQKDRVFFNGCTTEEIRDGERMGIHGSSHLPPILYIYMHI